MDVSAILRVISRRSFGALLVLTPLVMFPWTVSPLEINKQVIVYILATVCVVSWLGEALFRRSLSVSLRAVWIPFLVFFGGAIISAIASLDPYTSVFGQSNQEYTSVVTVVLLGFVAYIGAHIIDAAFLRRLGVFVLGTAAIVGIMGVLPFFHVSFSGIPTNLIGTPNALTVYLVTMSLLGSGFCIVGIHMPRCERLTLHVSTTVTTCTALMMLFAIDYRALWILTMAGVVTLFALSFFHSVLLTRPARFILPMILLVSGIFFSILPSMVTSPFAPEVALSSSSTWKIVQNVMTHGGWAFGTGPGTFAIAFDQFHGAELNGTSFWDMRFDRGSSAFLTMIATFGIFAVLACCVGVISVCILSLRAFCSSQHPYELPWIAAWIATVFAWVMYPQNMTLAVCFWVLLGVVMHGITLRTKTFTFDHSPRAGFVAMIGFVTMAVSMVTIAFATLSKYRADVAFAQAVNMNRGGQAIDDVIAKLDDAASANRWSDVYYRNLAHALLQKVNDVAKESTADSGEIKALIGAAVNASVRATELSPSTVTNWDMRGDTYRAVSPFVADAAVFAVSAYETAVRLAPTNPRYLVDLARGHIAYADVLAPIVQGEDEEKSVQATQIQNDALQKATEALLSAIALKSDYADARYYLASVQERQEKLADAIASMELVRVGAPTDIGVGLQLALLYLRQGKNELAKNELNRVLALAPNFSNAHWYLAAMLEKENDIDGALKELEIIMEIDPENETVQKKIDALRAGTRTQAPVPDPLPATEPTALPDENSTP